MKFTKLFHSFKNKITKLLMLQSQQNFYFCKTCVITSCYIMLEETSIKREF